MWPGCKSELNLTRQWNDYYFRTRLRQSFQALSGSACFKQSKSTEVHVWICMFARTSFSTLLYVEWNTAADHDAQTPAGISVLQLHNPKTLQNTSIPFFFSFFLFFLQCPRLYICIVCMYICLNCIYLYLNVYCQCIMLTVCTKGLRVTQFQFSVCMYCTCGRTDNKEDLAWLDLTWLDLTWLYSLGFTSAYSHN